jgi:hypothetical protein
MFRVMLCGSRTRVGEYCECQMVEALPSSTFWARAVACSLEAVATHPVRGSTAGAGAGGGGGSVASASAMRFSSAAALYEPRFAAAVIAVSRTNRVATGVNCTVFSSALSAHVPVVTGVPQSVPFTLTWIS